MFRPVAETVFEDVREPGEVAVSALGLTLRTISAASRIALSDERAGIMADFARRMAAARMTADPHQLGGILRVIKEQRRAALAIASRKAPVARDEKRQAVLQNAPTQRPRRKSGRRRFRKLRR
jgi:hypothetical protein